MYTYLDDVRKCFPLDQTAHVCKPRDCFFLKSGVEYVCQFSGHCHTCDSDECHIVIHEEENVRCSVTGVVVDQSNLDFQAERHFADDEPEATYGGRDAMVTTDINPVVYESRTKRKLEDERNETGDMRELETVKEEEKALLARLKDNWRREAAAIDVALVWNALYDQHTDRQIDKDKWREALVALWHVYQLARTRWEAAYAALTPHEFVVTVVRGVLDRKPWSLQGGKIYLPPVAHHLTFSSSSSIQLTLPAQEVRLSRGGGEQHTRRLRLQEDDARATIEVKYTKKRILDNVKVNTRAVARIPAAILAVVLCKDLSAQLQPHLDKLVVRVQQS
jgi:hypothetical protein